MTITDFLRQIRENAWSSRQLGTEFERFVKRYLKVEPSYASQFSDVWLWSECPFAKGSDVGIDLVARTNFGEYVAIQAKCYQPGTQVDKADVDTFLSASGKQIAPDGKPTCYSARIIIATNDNWTNHASEAIVDQQIPVTRIGLAQIQNSAIDWEKFFAGAKKTIVKKSVRPHQEAAIKDVVKGFEKRERGQLIMACGTGKTFTSLKIAESICPENGRVLFLVPSISLLGQSLREWCEQAEKPLTPFAVCSDSKVTKDPDDTSLADLGFPATTSAAQLVAYGRKLKKNPPAGLTVVFSTYQSISAVQEAQAAGAFGSFDLIICDEAHRTTGAIFKDKDESEFVRIHDKNFIKGKKRLYMTATPRIYGENAKKKADDEFIELCSMDDESKYGPEFHHLTFSAAVKDDLLTDYKVLILAVDEKDMRDLSLADRDGDGEIDSVDQLAKIVGTWKGLNKRIYKDDAQFLGGDIRPMRSAVAFTSTIAESKAYTGQFNAVIEEHFGEDENLQPVEIRHVDGGMNALYRSRQLQWLREADDTTGCRILSNAKCLSEGVDVPGLDAVIFLSPKNSFVEVVQAIGRVMRKAPGKQLGYVIIPVLIPMGMDASEALSTNKRFKVIWDVLSAIRSHDDAFNALDNKVDIIRVEPPKKKRKKPTGDGIGEGEGEDDGFDEEDPPLTIDTERFNDYKKAIQAKLVKACGEHKYWSVWAAEIAEVVQTQIKRITALLNAKDSPYEEDFSRFHETLKANLNKTVTRDEAIAMLAQQLVSAPVFDALFADYQFIRNNPISKSLEKLLARLNENIDGKDRETLEKFYESVRHKASDKTTAAQKQSIVVQLYNNFFNIAFKDTVEKLGIVYTPVPVVDFIVKSVECVLKKHFDCSISDRGVHVLDPFTGTGTFITRLLQSGFIKPKDLLYKYENEIHANEIVLLAYYIAAINIESVFHDAIADGKFHPFDGIVLTDTFQLGEGERDIPGIFPENSARAKKQKKLDIRVIIGNPPYNVSKGTSYPILESRIADTYAKGTSAVLKSSLYDSYIKAFRWASDRIKDEGVVAFVTNGGWLDAQAMNGFRNALVEEFSHVYVFNLRGNQRTQGETSRREGGKIFGQGSRTPVAITILVKNKNHSGKGEIHYHDIGDYLSREEKLRIIDDFGDIAGIEWQTITPDKHGDWLNKRDSEFDDYIPLAPSEKFDHLTKSWFTFGTVGTKTNRDVWAINYSAKTVLKNMEGCIAFYNKCAETKVPKEDSKQISWTRANRNRCEKGLRSIFRRDAVQSVAYRPFAKQALYCDREWNEVIGIAPYASPTRDSKNKVICVTAPGGSKDFSCIMVDCIPDFHLCGDVQAFPLYWYEKVERNDSIMELPGLEKQRGYIRHDAISDFILMEFRKIAGPRVQKEDIFHYVYGALHNPDYRAKFAADLKKQLPRLPLPKDRKEFEKVEGIGRKLANLHLHYEEIDPWPLDEVGSLDYHVTKMSWAKDGKDVRKDMLVVNEHLTLAGIPAEAHQYVVNGRTPLEWLIDRYQIRTDVDSGIVNDPNKWGEEHDYPQYIVELAKRLVRLSVETVNLVAGLAGKSKAQKTAEAVAAHPSATPPYWWKSGVWGVESPMPEGGNVVMGLKQKWYDKIEAGLKHEEYREKKPYWDERLGGRKGRELRSVTFMRGQASPVQMTWEVLDVEAAKDPGRTGYYIIQLGKRIK